MAANLTTQVRNIADVTTAVAKGDLSRKITVSVRGEFGTQEHDQHRWSTELRTRLPTEVTRRARSRHRRQTGRPGRRQRRQRHVERLDRLGERDGVEPDVAGAQHRRRDDGGGPGRLVAQDHRRRARRDSRAQEHDQHDGRPAERVRVRSHASRAKSEPKENWADKPRLLAVSGTWRDLTESVNGMASNLTNQVRNIAEVTTAVAKGDLSKKITVDAREILELKNTINTMVDQLNAFASEVTRVAREVGTEGKILYKPRLLIVSGTWRDLTLSANLDGVEPHQPGAQHRRSDDGRRQRRLVEEDHRRRPRRNSRTEEHDQHDGRPVSNASHFKSRVAREVGSEGRLGGQAFVRGVAGTWKDLTDSVNSMASNLTSQVRNIAEVTTAVALGDSSLEDHRRRARRDSRFQGHDQHDGRPANAFASEVTRRAKSARKANKGSAAGPRRQRHVEGLDRQRQLDGEQPDEPSAWHRADRYVGRQRRPRTQIDARSQGRNRAAGGHDQRHDRHAGDVRRPSHDGRARGRLRREAGRSSRGPRRRRPVARSDRLGQPTGSAADVADPRDRRSGRRR